MNTEENGQHCREYEGRSWRQSALTCFPSGGGGTPAKPESQQRSALKRQWFFYRWRKRDRTERNLHDVAKVTVRLERVFEVSEDFGERILLGGVLEGHLGPGFYFVLLELGRFYLKIGKKLSQMFFSLNFVYDLKVFHSEWFVTATGAFLITTIAKLLEVLREQTSRLITTKNVITHKQWFQHEKRFHALFQSHAIFNARVDQTLKARLQSDRSSPFRWAPSSCSVPRIAWTVSSCAECCRTSRPRVWGRSEGSARSPGSPPWKSQKPSMLFKAKLLQAKTQGGWTYNKSLASLASIR